MLLLCSKWRPNVSSGCQCCCCCRRRRRLLLTSPSRLVSYRLHLCFNLNAVFCRSLSICFNTFQPSLTQRRLIILTLNKNLFTVHHENRCIPIWPPSSSSSLLYLIETRFLYHHFTISTEFLVGSSEFRADFVTFDEMCFFFHGNFHRAYASAPALDCFVLNHLFR